MKRVPYMIVSAVLIFGSSISYFARTYAQSSGLQPLPGHSPEGFAGSENRWRLSAVNLKTQEDPVDPAIRAARNAFWMAKANEYDNAERNHVTIEAAQGTYSVEEPEIKKDPKALWVTAAFDHYLVLQPSSTSRFLYTEIAFAVKDVIWQPESSKLAAGESFDVDLSGGRAVTRNNVLLSASISTSRYFVQPGHVYLMKIVPSPSGGFYSIENYWDVTTGKVVPDRPDDVRRASQGLSKLSGLSVSEAISEVRSTLIASN